MTAIYKNAAFCYFLFCELDNKKKGVIFIIAVLILFLTVAVLTDLVKDKIYNAWIVPGLACGLFSSLIQGTSALYESMTAMGAALLILLPIYFLRGIAAGDVKLLTAAASYLSMQETISCIIISFLIAGIISIAVLILKRNKQRTIHFAVPVLVSVLFVVGGVL